MWKEKKKKKSDGDNFRINAIVDRMGMFEDSVNKHIDMIFRKCRRLVLENERVERKMWEIDAYLLKKYDGLVEQIADLNNKTKFMDIFNV